MQSNSVIVKDPDILWGTVVFQGTRVPFEALVDYLEGGATGRSLRTVEATGGKVLWSCDEVV